MNDNDVIKCLEELTGSDNPEKLSLVVRLFLEDALSCINRLKADDSNLVSDVISLQSDLTSAKAENERLQSLALAKDIIIKDIQKRYDTCFEEKAAIVQGMAYTINKAKSEARKEFADGLKSKFRNGDEVLYAEWLIHYEFDNILAEMDGKENSDERQRYGDKP